jgi:DNA replication protein DnaC
VLPERYANSTDLEGVVPITGQEQAVDALKKWAWRGQGVQENVILIGGVGSGKTHIAVAAIKSRAAWANSQPKESYDHMVGGHTCFINLPALMDGLKTAIGVSDSDAEREYNHIKNKCRSVVLDDIGAERITEYSLERIYVVIDALYNRQASIVATTNVPLGTLAAQGMTRVISRLSEGATIVRMNTLDIRATRRA